MWWEWQLLEKEFASVEVGSGCWGSTPSLLTTAMHPRHCHSYLHLIPSPPSPHHYHMMEDSSSHLTSRLDPNTTGLHLHHHLSYSKQRQQDR